MITLVLAASVLIGVSLGILGGGGSILTVPILVYLAGQDSKEAIATSLFVVGVTSLVGLANDFRSTCTSASLESAGLEGTVGNDWDELYDQELSFVNVDPAEIDARIGWLLGETATAQPAPVAITVDNRRTSTL